MQHLSWRHLSISAIFQLLLTWLWPNFKDRFLGPFLTYSNCHYDIFSGNICPCDICPYQEYLSCHWPDVDQTLKVGPWDHLKHIPTVTVTFMKNFIKKNLPRKISSKKFATKNIAKKIFAEKNFCHKIFFDKIRFFSKRNFAPQKIFQQKIIFAEKKFTENKIVEKKFV